MTATEVPGGQFAYSSDLWTPNDVEIAAYEQDQHRHAEAILAPVKASAKRLGLEIETVHVPDRRAAPAILDTAHKCGCDVIVMASHGRTGISRVMLGSHTAEVLTNADIPVIVFR